jgi:hypothetical protein
MGDGLERGDRVEWSFRGRRVVGRVVRKLTSRTVLEGRVVAASRDDPRHVVKSEKTGKQTPRRARALRKVEQSDASA